MLLSLQRSAPLFTTSPKYRKYFTSIFLTAYLLSETVLICILCPWYLRFPWLLHSRMERCISGKGGSIPLKKNILCFWSDKNECSFECLRRLNKYTILEHISAWRSESAYNRYLADISATLLPGFCSEPDVCPPFRAPILKTIGTCWRKSYCYPIEFWSNRMQKVVPWKWLKVEKLWSCMLLLLRTLTHPSPCYFQIFSKYCLFICYFKLSYITRLWFSGIEFLVWVQIY